MKKKIMTACLHGLLCVGGIAMTSLSAAIYYFVDLGSDPIQVLISGLSHVTHVSYGLMITLVNIVITIFLIWKGRHYVKAALILSVVLAGFFVDQDLVLLHRLLPNPLSFWEGIFLGLAGCLIMILGIFIYLYPGWGASPTDGLGLYLAERFHLEYGRMRTILDVLSTILGWLLGGNFGVITVIAAISTGPLLSVLERLFHHKLTRS